MEMCLKREEYKYGINRSHRNKVVREIRLKSKEK